MGTLATNYTPISIISVISLVGGYGGLYLLWRFVFSSKQTHDDTHDRARRDEALRAAAAAPADDGPPAPRDDGRTPASGHPAAE